MGSAEKVAEVRSAGSIGAALTVDLTLTLPDGVSVVLVRIRMVPPSIELLRNTSSLPSSGVLKLLP